MNAKYYREYQEKIIINFLKNETDHTNQNK